MSNFGVFDLRLVEAYDVAFREARSAVKAQNVLENAREFSSVVEAVADCELVVGTTSLGPRVLEQPLRRLEYGGKMIAKKMATAPVALLFGSEKTGLSNEDMSHCHWLMRIPSREEHGSMNLGQAAAICLYEIVRNPSAAKIATTKKKPANAEELERVSRMLEKALEVSGYVPERTKESAQLKTRRFIHRMQLDGADARIWLGMLRQIVWKLEHPEEPDTPK